MIQTLNLSECVATPLSDNFVKRGRLVQFCCISLFLFFSVVHIESVMGQGPYIPESDNQVLVTLPQSLLVNRDLVQELRDRLSRDPDNSQLASTVAHRYLSIGKRGGGPRFFGYARAAISQWWEDKDAPSSILRIRAKLKENDHRYGEAADDIRLALKKKPTDPQLLLELANVLRVQGIYDEAYRIADQLEDVSGDVPAALCRAPLMVMTGHAGEASQLLDDILPEAKSQFPATLPWIATVKAEAADALGNSDDLADHFESGLEQDSGNLPLLRRYADFLLDRNANSRVIELLEQHAEDTGVLVRLAIAAKRSDDSRFVTWKKSLEDRFAEIRLRGSEPHGRFEARFELHVEGDPKSAIELAKKNWQRQKETLDARIFLESAVAIGDAAEAEPVLAFIRHNNLQHTKLDPLVKELEGLK